jgi:oligosaccharide repeat unit polymerase
VLAIVLYNLKLSELLLFNTAECLPVLSCVLLPFLSVSGLVVCLLKGRPASALSQAQVVQFNPSKVTRKVGFLFLFWCGITTFESITAGGLPLYWIMIGDPRTYMDFGIPSVHGFANSIVAGISLVAFPIYILFGRRAFLGLAAFGFLWAISAVARQLFTVIFLEMVLFVLMVKGRALRARHIVMLLGCAVLFIQGFGVLGDMRSGRERFLELSQPTPVLAGLPSGLVWSYMYVVTPLNNLVNASVREDAGWDVRYSYTLSLLLPSVIRPAAMGPNYEPNPGRLVTSAFTVSTAFIESYRDLGLLGVALYSGIIGFVANLVWYNLRTLRQYLTYAVLGQCLILSAFYNHFLLLPVLLQVVWIYVLL